VAIFLLILLAIFASPGMLPSALPSLIPGADESIPCQWLRTGTDRAEHQSLIGRNAQNPISLHIRSTALPGQPGQVLSISILITNNSMGTVAIYYNPDQVRIGDDGATSGLGLVFNSPTPQAFGSAAGGFVPESDIRLLGPRQSCIHHVDVPFEQISQLPLTGAQNSVKAYYRNTVSGPTQPQAGTTQTIFSDQGLWVGVTESESIALSIASAGS
jgi:hypothetical protein